MWLRAVLLAALLIAVALPAAAQVPLVVRTVTSCGTVPTSYIAGSNNPATQDVNGQFCTNATGGGGGSVTQGTVPWVDNVTQLGGAAINLGTGTTGTGTQRVSEASDSPLIAAINSAAPCFNATAFNTNSYSNAGTNPMNCDLNGGLYVHPPANQTVAQATASSLNATVVGTGTFAVQAASTLTAETTKVIGTVRVSAMAAAARNAPGCTVGTSSAQCLAAAQAVNFLQIQNVNATSTNNVACNIVGGTAVLNSATSVQLSPGQSASWGPNTGGVPSGAINCIATSASSPLYVEWN